LDSSQLNEGALSPSSKTKPTTDRFAESEIEHENLKDNRAGVRQTRGNEDMRSEW
jgi:hypothetical protein